MAVIEGGRFQIPVWDPERLNIAYKNYQLPSWNTEGSDPLSMHDVVLGYLAQIFLATCLPSNPPSTIQRIAVTGDGEVRGSEIAFSQQLGVASIDAIFIPPDSDYIFGRFPTTYLGLAGFGIVDEAVQIAETETTRFTLDLNIAAPRYYPPQFINHERSVFVPPNPGVNLFYWRLKPGVIANIAASGQVDTGGINSGNGVQFERFNPMLGGFDRDDVFVQP